MYHFFVDKDNIEGNEIVIDGSDVNHIKNVLRLDVGSEIIIGDKLGKDYNCVIDTLTNDSIRCKILTTGISKAELPIHITLVQGAPKLDKMELIVQKAVELGVFNIKPIIMKRSIVKYDAKRAAKKLSRWQSIAESAAKQSKRGIIPIVDEIVLFKDVLSELCTYDKVIIPYENESGMKATREVFKSLTHGQKVAIVIGPEGGFAKEEIDALLKIGGVTISLGNRILRTETAGLASLAMISYQIEEV